MAATAAAPSKRRVEIDTDTYSPREIQLGQALAHDTLRWMMQLCTKHGLPHELVAKQLIVETAAGLMAFVETCSDIEALLKDTLPDIAMRAKEFRRETDH
ncbi:MAG: hypothetical protein U1E46_05945 [Hyphomicrobiales bacterium]